MDINMCDILKMAALNSLDKFKPCGNLKTDILNASSALGSFFGIMNVLEAVDKGAIESYIEISEQTKAQREKLFEITNKIY